MTPPYEEFVEREWMKGAEAPVITKIKKEIKWSPEFAAGGTVNLPDSVERKFMRELDKSMALRFEKMIMDGRFPMPVEPATVGGFCVPGEVTQKLARALRADMRKNLQDRTFKATIAGVEVPGGVVEGKVNHIKSSAKGMIRVICTHCGLRKGPPGSICMRCMR